VNNRILKNTGARRKMSKYCYLADLSQSEKPKAAHFIRSPAVARIAERTNCQ